MLFDLLKYIILVISIIRVKRQSNFQLINKLFCCLKTLFCVVLFSTCSLASGYCVICFSNVIVLPFFFVFFFGKRKKISTYLIKNFIFFEIKGLTCVTRIQKCWCPDVLGEFKCCTFLEEKITKKLTNLLELWFVDDFTIFEATFKLCIL